MNSARRYLHVVVLAVCVFSLTACATPSSQGLATSAAAEQIAGVSSDLLKMGNESSSDAGLVSEVTVNHIQGAASLIGLTSTELDRLRITRPYAGVYSVDRGANGVSVGLVAIGRGEKSDFISPKRTYAYLCVDLVYDRSNSGRLTATDAECPSAIESGITDPLNAILIRYKDLRIDETVSE